MKRGNKYTPKSIYRRAVKQAQLNLYGPGFPAQKAESVSLDSLDHVIRYKELLAADEKVRSFHAVASKAFWYGNNR